LQTVLISPKLPLAVRWMLHRRRGRSPERGDQVALVGFGTFAVRERAARSGRNPQTGATIEIAAGKVPAFKAGKALKDAVN
jgi:DNA-binding protein HU-beta